MPTGTKDPTTPGKRLPDFQGPAPSYQQDARSSFPPAKADEPKLKRVGGPWQKASKTDDGALARTRQSQCVACHTNGAYDDAPPALTPYLGAPRAEVRDLFADSAGK